MDRLTERFDVAKRALATLVELPLDGTPTKVERDAAIQRFEYTFEAVWKAAQLYLREVEGLEIGSPKGSVRACLEVNVLSEDEARGGLEMADDRNRTVHTYAEPVAAAVFANLSAHARLMDRWLAEMTARARGAGSGL
jgi:nucleotidyltransferase substrate binding protein (TIGR01987 family)